jgi:uncharacterized membrane protein (TIGR02234 family)
VSGERPLRARRYRAEGLASRRLAALSGRQELVAVLALGAVGAGLVFLAMRQGWAQVRTDVPAPLPDSVVTDNGQSLVPFADALAIAALASLAAMLATRRLARRVAGALLAAIGVALAAAAIAGVSTAAALSAASGTLGSRTGAGAGSAAGSVTEGGTQTGSPAVPNVAGFHSHVTLTAAPWQAMTVLGALAIIAAGLLVAYRATRLPEMSARYDSPAAREAEPAKKAQPSPASPRTAVSARPDAATLWESLSRGEDPT